MYSFLQSMLGVSVVIVMFVVVVACFYLRVAKRFSVNVNKLTCNSVRLSLSLFYVTNKVGS